MWGGDRMEQHSKKELSELVNAAKKDKKTADELISAYMPFIKSETAKFLKRPPIESDDELSIAMFAFYEAIQSYSWLRGSFVNFASLQIKNRLIDNYRREKRNTGLVSLDDVNDEGSELIEIIKDKKDEFAENEIREATRTEIEELSAQMQNFGVSMSDIAENSPRQKRTLEICQKAVLYARENSEILEEFLRTKRVPLAKLADGANVERKSLERHRKYLVAVLLICTNGYEIMRGHIFHVLKGR